jgi:hypothetical protein
MTESAELAPSTLTAMSTEVNAPTNPSAMSPPESASALALRMLTALPEATVKPLGLASLALETTLTAVLSMVVKPPDNLSANPAVFADLAPATMTAKETVSSPIAVRADLATIALPLETPAVLKMVPSVAPSLTKLAATKKSVYALTIVLWMNIARTLVPLTATSERVAA